MTFFDRLADRIEAVDSVVSVGLDPDLDRIPERLRDRDLPRWAFNRRIIDATHEHAAAFKPNAAFYEDPDGWRALQETVAYAHGKDVPVLLDAKRADLQDLKLDNGACVYEQVAALADLWNRNGNVGLVVGATAPEELAELREQVPDLPFLVPGVGAQGGDAEAAVEHGLADGVGLVNSSRGIIFAGEQSSPSSRTRSGDAGEGRGADDEFARAAGEAAKRLKRRLNRYR